MPPNSTEQEIEICLNVIRQRHEEDAFPVVLGISGPVASGKSYLTRCVTKRIIQEFDVGIVHLPFDYWIDSRKRQHPIYAERFLLEDFAQALRDIKERKAWMCPRYDLSSVAADKTQDFLLGREKKWSGRKFRRIENIGDTSKDAPAKEFLLEHETGQIYEYHSPQKAVYLIDGTMIFTPPKVKRFYDLREYVEAPWIVRVARMVGRYRRGEIFAGPFSSEEEYVQFLIDEAKQCADKETADQLSEDIRVIENAGASSSDIEDLSLLYDKVVHDRSLQARYSIAIEKVKALIEENTTTHG